MILIFTELVHSILKCISTSLNNYRFIQYFHKIIFLKINKNYENIIYHTKHVISSQTLIAKINGKHYSHAMIKH